MVDLIQTPYGPDAPEPTIPGPQDPYRNHDVLRYAASIPAPSNDWINSMLSPVRPGTFIGGPNINQLFDTLSPGGHTLNGPKPGVSDPLALDLNAPRADHLGNFSLDLLDIGGSFQGLMQAAGLRDPNTQPGGDPVGAFFQDKNIDLFGMGATGAPARLFDYADPKNWVPIMLVRRALGDTSMLNDPQRAADALAQSDKFFAFHMDPRYWQYIRQTTETNPTDDTPLQALAKSIATDNVGDAYSDNLYRSILDQIHTDRTVALALSSGDARTDWIAKSQFQVMLLSGQPTPQPQQQQIGGTANVAAGQPSFVDAVLNLFTNVYGKPAEPGEQVQSTGLGVISALPIGPPSAGTAPLFPNPLGQPFTPLNQQAQQNPQALANLLSAVPFLGAGIAQTAYPVKPETETAWENLSVEQRQNFISFAQTQQGLVDTAALVVGFGGLSAIRGLALAGNFTKYGEAAAHAYDLTLKVTNIVMAIGVTNAVANWGLEAASPYYKQEIGKYIDASRPVSQSALAGVINTMGFLGSGSYGTAQALKFWRGGAGLALDAAARAPGLGRFVPRPIFGVKEFQFFRTVFGGTGGVNDIVKGAKGVLNETEVRLAIQRGFLSETVNGIMDTNIGRVMASYVDALTNPNSKHALRELASSDRAAFDAAWERDLALAAEATPGTTEAVMRVLSHYHPDLSPFAIGAEEGAAKRAQELARFLDDMATRGHMGRYGALWERFNTAEAIQQEAKKLYSEIGVPDADVSHIGAGAHGVERGKQVLMGLHQVAFNRKYAELLQAAKESKEASTVSIGSLRNLFGDEIDAITKVLRGGTVDPAELRAGMPTTADEMFTWVMERENVANNRILNGLSTPTSLADKLERIAEQFPSRRTMDSAVANAGDLNTFQQRLEAEGRWTVIYKPRRKPFSGIVTDANPIEQSITGQERAASDFASVRHLELEDGSIVAFKSPWIEYPMHSLDQIELGNRGVLASLFDSATMGTRAWRIAEFQRANLHRIMTSTYKVTDSQIAALHQGMQSMSATPIEGFTLFGKRYFTQATKAERVMRSMQGWAWTDQARQLAEHVFGKELINVRTGLPEVVNWNELLANAYRQSMRLNLTAGLTSRLKALPVVGPAAVKLGEDMYVSWRFGLSPLFKASEYVESAGFNLMRGVYWDDPVVRDMILRSVGRDAQAILHEEIAATNSEMQGIGSAVIEGSTRSRIAAEVGTYAQAGQGRSIKAARQTSKAQLAGEADPTALSKSLSFERNNPQQMRAYTPQTSNFDIKYSKYNNYSQYDDEAMVSRDGRDTMTKLLADEQSQWVQVTPPEQLAQAAHWDPYLRPLSDSVGPAFYQPLRRIPSAAWPAHTAPVALKPTAFENIQPFWKGIEPVTPEGFYRLKQLELQKSIAAADPHETLKDVLMRYYDEQSAFTIFHQGNDHRWADVEAIFLKDKEQDQWAKFLARTPEGHPARDVTVRLYDGTPEGLREAQVLYHAERAGIADMLSREIGATAVLDIPAQRVARNVTSAVDTPAFRDTLRVLASDRRGMDVGEPMVRTYLRFNPSTKTDQLVVTFAAGDGTSLALTPVEVQEAWLQTMQSYGASLPDDVSSFLARQGRDAVAWEPLDGTAGRLHVYRDPAKATTATYTTDAFGSRQFSDPEHPALDVVFAAKFDAIYSYQPLSDMHPRVEFDSLVHDQRTNRVTYEPRSKRDSGWSYGYDEQPNYVQVYPENAILHDYQWEQQFRDIFYRFGDKPIVISLPDNASADALARLWIRGELPERVHVNYLHRDNPGVYDALAADEQRVFAKALTDEGYWLHGSTRPGARPEGSSRPYYTAKDFETAYDYSNQTGASMFVAEAPKKPVAFWKGSAERDRFLTEAGDYLNELHDDINQLVMRTHGIPAGPFDKPGTAQELRDAFEKKWPQIEVPTFIPNRYFDPVDARASLHEAIMAGDDMDISSVMQSFDAQVDNALFEVGFGHIRNETTQLGAKGANLDIAQRLGYDGLEFDYGAHMFRSSKYNPDNANPVMVYVNGQPAVRTISEFYAMRNPGVEEIRPFDLATMRTRMGVPEDAAARVPRATGTMSDMVMTGDAQMAQIDAMKDLSKPNVLPKSIARRIFEKWSNPVPFKLEQQSKLEALIIRNTWGDVLKTAHPRLYEVYTKDLKVPHNQLTAFKVEDRMLYENWVRSGSREDFDALVAHASKYTGDAEDVAKLVDLYESEDWSTLMALWHINAQAAGQEAFTVHFFSTYRSMLERSLNHPILGVFPLSWSYKAAREWGKFLFNNTSLGLRLGMTPAVALKQIQRAEDEAWAKNPDSVDQFGHVISSDRRVGPFSSLAFMANLMLPGDWSSIPFPLAWPIRSIIRGDFASPFNPGQYWDNWGPSRDFRLAQESVTEIMNWLAPPGQRVPQSDTAVSNRTHAREKGIPVVANPPAVNVGGGPERQVNPRY